MINLKCTFAVTAGLCSSLAYAQNQPHIILIMTDQQRGDAMGCMGNESVISPHLDALASEGTLFMNGYSSCPSSTPARAGLLTGQSPWHHGLLGYGKIAPKYNHENASDAERCRILYLRYRKNALASATNQTRFRRNAAG